jgi:predicted metalloprotease with PDZ domain
MHRRLMSSLVAASVLGTAGHAFGQAPVSYEVSFPNAAHHEVEIAVSFPGIPRGVPLEAWMSRSSPGRYAVHEFAKNVYNLRAEDGRGRPLAVEPINPYSWRVAGHDGTVRVRYTLFGDRADGTYAQIDRRHAHLNAPATFLWGKGLERRPVHLRFASLPEGWRVATQLKPTADPAAFTAPHLQLFLDSPITVGPLDIRSWLVTNGARLDTIRLAVHHLGTTAEVDRYVEMVKRVVHEQTGVFGELPRFDWGTYTFLAVYLPWASGDGMEHRNSTSLTSTRPLATGMLDNLGTVSHEFFHAWNVERIRPRTLEPFDFTQANMSGELWFAEGFTSYYGDLLLRRAGFFNDSEYAASLGGSVNAVVNGTGRRYFSAVDMSRQAAFTDAAVSIDPNNRTNTFISYYTWGEAIAAGLDLTLRARFPGVTLDDYMRAMWVRHGKTERPYTVNDLQVVLGQVTRDTAFANDYFRRYVTGRDVPDYEVLFATVGFLFRPARAGAAWLGDVTWSGAAGRAVAGSRVRVGQPIYATGMEQGDTLLTLAGRPVGSANDIQAILDARRPGDTLEVSFRSRGVTVDGRVVLATNPRMELVPAEAGGATVAPGALEARRRWLGSKAGTQGAPR